MDNIVKGAWKMMGIDMAEDMLNYKFIIMVSKTLMLYYLIVMISE